jgi:hypothetical protein
MKKTKKQLIKETLDHYDRMIEWAEKQDENDIPSSGKMYKEIEEDWKGSNCPLCDYFYECEDCYIQKKHGHCESTAWYDMHYYSKTWGKWLVHAKKMRKIIKEL